MLCARSACHVLAPGCSLQQATQEPDPCPLVQGKYDLHLPEYPGAAQCVRIGGTGTERDGSAQNGRQHDGRPGDVAAMRISYDRGGLTEDQAHPDPYTQFDR